MSLEENKELVRRLAEEGINQGNIPAVNQLLSSDFVLHHPTGQEFSRETYGKNLIMSRNAFPDSHMDILDLFGRGDRVACRWMLHGTHKGVYQGMPPTGNKFSIQGINIFRIADGKIVEIWSQSNTLGMMQQLGMIPPMGRR